MLNKARELAEKANAEKQEIAANNEELKQHSKQVEAEKHSVQLELGNTAALLQARVCCPFFSFFFLSSSFFEISYPFLGGYNTEN
jgi:hypothetical protein